MLSKEVIKEIGEAIAEMLKKHMKGGSINNLDFEENSDIEDGGRRSAGRRSAGRPSAGRPSAGKKHRKKSKKSKNGKGKSAGRKPSAWIERCKEYAKKHNCSYKSAMMALKK